MPDGKAGKEEEEGAEGESGRGSRGRRQEIQWERLMSRFLQVKCTDLES